VLRSLGDSIYREPILKETMDWLINFLYALRDRLTHRGRGQVVVMRPEPRRQQFRPEARADNRGRFNPAAYALYHNFPSRHTADEEVTFRPVNAQNTVVQQTEEWFREGNSMRTRLRKTMVVTCSGQIVPTERLQGICWCGGYEDAISRCAVCARPLCRLHARVFSLEPQQLILCDRHYRKAINRHNTWNAMDRGQRNS
jgi:hypothetical protein